MVALALVDRVDLAQIPDVPQVRTAGAVSTDGPQPW
jgi:hypothetical protein